MAELLPNEDVSAAATRFDRLATQLNAFVFPQEAKLDNGTLTTPGLTKRELFAAMAMQGYCMQAAEYDWELAEVAADAVAQADALLAALDVTEKNNG